MEIRSRLSEWKAILGTPWKWLVLAPSAILGLYQEIQQQFAQGLPAAIPISPLWWLVITLVLACLLILEGAYRRIKAIQNSHRTVVSKMETKLADMKVQNQHSNDIVLHTVYAEGHFSSLNDKAMENTIRQWLDKPGLLIKRIQTSPELYFEFVVQDQYERTVGVSRDKNRPELVTVAATVNWDTSRVQKIIQRRSEINPKWALELSNLKISYHINEATESVTMFVVLPVDDSLTETRFLVEGVDLVVRGLVALKAILLQVIPNLFNY